jgi:hypothetical protein
VSPDHLRLPQNLHAAGRASSQQTRAAWHVGVTCRWVELPSRYGEGAQCSAGVVVAILIALAVLWATGSLGPVYRWLVVLRSHSISRAVSSETARHCCRSSELISRVFMNHVLFRRATDSANQNCRQADTPPPIVMPCLWEDDEVSPAAPSRRCPAYKEADHVRTKHHNPGAALVR